MDRQQIKAIIIKELPAIFRENDEIQGLILRLSSGRFAEKVETKNPFDRLLDRCPTLSRTRQQGHITCGSPG